MHFPDPLSQALKRLRTHRWEEAREDLPIAVPGHSWSEAEAEKRELDLIELTTAAAILAIDHFGLLRMQRQPAGDESLP
jgi:hypothetical protein